MQPRQNPEISTHPKKVGGATAAQNLTLGKRQSSRPLQPTGKPSVD
jgi:hypothetical protein